MNNDQEKVLLYRNKYPNSPRTPPVANIIGDESENFTLRTIYMKVQPFINQLRKYNMKVAGLNLNFEVDMQADGKLRNVIQL